MKRNFTSILSAKIKNQKPVIITALALMCVLPRAAFSQASMVTNSSNASCWAEIKALEASLDQEYEATQQKYMQVLRNNPNSPVLPGLYLKEMKPAAEEMNLQVSGIVPENAELPDCQIVGIGENNSFTQNQAVVESSVKSISDARAESTGSSLDQQATSARSLQ